MTWVTPPRNTRHCPGLGGLSPEDSCEKMCWYEGQLSTGCRQPPLGTAPACQGTPRGSFLSDADSVLRG